MKVLISGTFGIFHFHHIFTYLRLGHLIAYSAGLFLASVRSSLKTTGIMKMYGICKFFFCDPMENFHKSFFFLKNYSTNF